MLTFGQAKIELAQYCGTGMIAEDERVGFCINQAVERLMNKPDNWSYTTPVLSFCAPNGCLTLPREVAKIIKAHVNGRFASVQSTWYNFLSNGPGFGDGRHDQGYYMGPLQDRGFACTQYDIPAGHAMKIMLVSDRTEDDGTKVLIRGNDETGREVHMGTAQWGELIPLHGGLEKEAWISESRFSSITSIQKPITKGYVYVSAIWPEQGIRYFLGSIHPDETVPQYRRYYSVELPSCACRKPDGTYVAPIPNRIDALCRLQYVAAVHDSDVLLIQNRAALKMMLKCIAAEDGSDIEIAAKWEGTAVRLMGEQTSMLENAELTLDVNKDSLSGGHIERV